MTDPKKGHISERNGVEVILCSILKDIVLNHTTAYYAASLDRDVLEILKRYRTRGLPFLMTELPELGKALDSALQFGKFVIPPQFKRMGWSNLPQLFFVLWSKIFDLDGSLKEFPDDSAIVDLRFLTKAFYKYEAEYDVATVVKAVEDFKETDRSLPKELPSRGPIAAVLEIARTLITEVLGTPPEYFIPGHSSGAVSTGEKSWEKTRGLVNLPQYKILGGRSNFYINPRELFYLGPFVDYCHRTVPIAKMVDVPKDARGPRLICEEPATQMFFQQGIKNELYARIENHPLTKGHVNFKDQSINQKFALIGSDVEPETVTLDMKEASDRVGDCLVERTHPTEWYKLFDAVRTELVEMPDGSLLPLSKHAPMGSALCFPIESLVHWALCCSCYMLAGYTSETVFQSVYVYGDDIVLRSLPPGIVFKVFPLLGLKFNEVKSCTKGKFRESCGVDAFKGQDISTLKFKKRIPTSSGNPEAHVAWVEYSNLAFERGFYQTARAIQKWLKEWNKFPYVRPNADVVGFTSMRPFGLCMQRSLRTPQSIASAIDDHAPVYRCKSIDPKRPREGQVDDRSRYFETILALARRGSAGESHTELSYAIKYAVRWKKVWSKSVVAYD